MVNDPFQARLAPRPTTVSGHNYPSVENKLKLYGLPLYTVLQKYAYIGLKQNLLRSTTLNIITRLRDNAAFVCVHVVGRFSDEKKCSFCCLVVDLVGLGFSPTIK